jgi:hypothetical protein
MQELELAKAMIELSELHERAAALRAVIEAEVLERGRTYRVGNVSATFRRPSQKIDYEQTARAFAPTDHTFERLRAAHTKVREITSWKEVCDSLEIDAGDYVVAETKPAQVTFKFA